MGGILMHQIGDVNVHTEGLGASVDI
jgi:hypothetical protein